MNLEFALKLRLHSETFSKKEIKEIKEESLKLKAIIEPDYRITVTENQVKLGIGLISREYWSPTLQMFLDQYPDKRTHVKVTIGPDPILWFLYKSLFYIVGILFIVFTAITISKLFFEQSFKLDIIMLFILTNTWLLLYFIAKFIRRKGMAQMKELEHFMNQILE